MESRMIYIVTLTCQGQRLERIEFHSLIRAFLHYAKIVKKYGKHGTMRFDMEAWWS